MKKVLLIFILLGICMLGLYKMNSHIKYFYNDTNISKSKENDKKIEFEKAYYDYEGTLGKDLKIQISLYPLENKIVGTYVDEKSHETIHLNGKIKGTYITLDKLNKNEKNIGVFKGNMKTIDGIEGTYIDNKSKKSMPFKVSLFNIIYAKYNHRYEIIGVSSDQEVEDFAKTLQNYIIRNEKEKIASLISYPISVTLHQKKIEIKNKEDFIKNYDQIFNPTFKDVIKNSFTTNMFVNAQGVLFGEGNMNIWFNYNKNFYIIAINN
ncbi:hypothetical protein [Inediibacterium massiliense]|uniref:hypothetical protein n=1 Tax=Inediibacterium massiliense TaxID=1658111 RepID=UPI0006B5016E|nr:hypothetical protein [Inediibacterium massiliense]